MEMPIGNRTARYGLAAARLRKIRAMLEYKDTENQVIQEVLSWFDRYLGEDGP